MVYDNNAFNILYKDYSNINQKIRLETKKVIILFKKIIYWNDK